MASKLRRILLLLSAVALVACGVVGYELWRRSRRPEPGSPRYEQYADAFQVGLVALDADVPQVAEERLTQAVELVPEEPAGWADRGLVYLRTGRTEEAARDLEQARRLAPESPEVLKLIGLLEQRRGRYGEAAACLEQALEHDPYDLKSRYLLGDVLEQEQKPGHEAARQQLLEDVLKQAPNNLRVLSDALQLAVRRADEASVREVLARMDELAPRWSPTAQTQLQRTKESLETKLGPSAVSSVLGLSNLLKAEPGYVRDAQQVSPPNELAGDSLQTFLRLAPLRSAPAPTDADLKFVSEPLPDAPAGPWDAAVAVWLTGDSAPEAFLAGGGQVWRVGGEAPLPSPARAPLTVTPIDWNNDQRTDLAIAGAGGLSLYQQQPDGAFEEIAKQAGLSKEALGDDYDGALAADLDLDGDLDLVLARAADAPLFLRNNFDGTFAARPIFADVAGPQRFVWADFDQDGAPDAALLDANGKLRVFANERSGNFIAWPAELPDARLLAAAANDANDDGALDIVAVDADGKLLCISDRNGRAEWRVEELAQWPVPAEGLLAVERLIAADFDNNGAMDLLASGSSASAIWLKDGAGRFQPLEAELPPRLQAAADLRGQGRLDLLAIDAAGHALRLLNAGEKPYHWQSVRPQAASGEAKGDNRINSFGIGGEIELRSGTLVVKQPIAAPEVHFGLGERTRADVIRIVWPNGVPQAEFKTPIDKTVTAVQRLKGSCPFLFAFDGEQMEFVGDFMWSTPLGMYINATDNGGLSQTAEWVKIAGDRLAPRGGKYELRVNANLWETHFFDHLSLVAVDHPDDAELYVDERFFMEPAEPALHLLTPPASVNAARDHEGRDALPEVEALDHVYLDRCGRGVYQGVTRDHWVEVELGDAAAGEGPLWLLACGWVHPTDSSINFALEQGRCERPRPLTLELPDGQGGWKAAGGPLGFPAGKNKTMLIRLDDLPDWDAASGRLRLRTNMEIYWDWLACARGRDDAPCQQQRLVSEKTELRFRGVVEMSEANRSSPELPDYDRIASVGQPWRDLIGYHTRYGDIRELLETVDDRYAILTAGDEIVLEFAAPPAPPPGWKRDFVWVSDGWVKDGDLNTRFGKTVLPLPWHGMQSYDQPPGRLEDDPVYRRHRRDWEIYHTRYVTPHAFEQGLRRFRCPRTGDTMKSR